MHLNLKNFISHLVQRGFPIRLENRCSNDSWTYDGNSIALKISENIKVPDHNILHEIGHWFISSDDQKLFPEYGLKLGVVNDVAFGEKGGEFRYKSGARKNRIIRKFNPGLVDLETQCFQELFAQQFCIFYGPVLLIDPKVYIPSYLSEDSQIFSWSLYEEEKTNDLMNLGFSSRVYSAILNFSELISWGNIKFQW